MRGLLRRAEIARPASRALALLLVLLVGLAYAPAAFAHASLVGSDPSDGVTVASAPKTLKLSFNEPIAPLVVRLVGPAGEAVTPAFTAENDTITITPPLLTTGTHVLSWRVISADGHPVGGAVTFSVGAPSATPAAAGFDTDPFVAAAIWSARLVIYLGLFVGAGGAAFIAFLARSRPLPGRTEKRIAGIMLAGLAAAIISIGLQGLDARALPLVQIWRPDAWWTGLRTSYGWTAGLAALAQVLGLAALHARGRVTSWFTAAGALAATGLALSASGHAATVEPQLLGRPIIFLHGVCIAFWIGSLLPLAAIVRAGDRGDDELAAFSRIIPFPLALLIASGAYLAWSELDRPDALWTTRYGEVLSVKLVLVVGLLGLAAVNRYVLVPRLKPIASKPSRRLAAVIATEYVVALLILWTVALWRFTPPPRSLIAAEPALIHFHGGKAMAQIEIEPVRARGADVSIEVLDGEFHPLAAKEVTIFLSNAEAGIEPVKRAAESVGIPNWRIDDLRIPVAGRWKLRVDVLINDFEKETLEDDVLLPRAP